MLAEGLFLLPVPRAYGIYKRLLAIHITIDFALEQATIKLANSLIVPFQHRCLQLKLKSLERINFLSIFVRLCMGVFECAAFHDERDEQLIHYLGTHSSD